MTRIIRNAVLTDERRLLPQTPGAKGLPATPEALQHLLAETRQSIVAQLRKETEAAKEVARRVGLREGRRAVATERVAREAQHRAELERARAEAYVRGGRETALRIVLELRRNGGGMEALERVIAGVLADLASGHCPE